MNTIETDITIIGAGPVGLMCAYLGRLSGLSTVIIDKSDGPLEVGRADALNARTLQLLETVGLFKDLYPIGKPVNTSSVWADGKFLSRQSSWWEELEGCQHKHFLMIGQSYVEKLLDEKLKNISAGVKRSKEIENVEVSSEGCETTLSSGEKIRSKYVIGADGSRSFVRNHFKIPFEIFRPKITWAVIDGTIETDFEKVPEIIVFQAETSDVAWIPREGKIDRFYVRMDVKEFTIEEAIAKINRAMSPHKLRFKEVEWFSQFSVKESVAENFFIKDRVFLAGDACHVHSVNGGQGLNTGLADAFNLMWKLGQVIKHEAPIEFLQSYEDERRPVAQSVIETSGELVRSTKYSESGTHAEDYVKIVQKRSGNITGMGIRYGEGGISGTRVYDFKVFEGENETRLYSLLDYSKYTLLLFDEPNQSNQTAQQAKEYGSESRLPKIKIPPSMNCLRFSSTSENAKYSAPDSPYKGQAVLVRPDSYIKSIAPIGETENLLQEIGQL